jgi:hypothetical protein
LYRITDYFFKGIPRWQQLVLLSLVISCPIALYFLPSGFDILVNYQQFLTGSVIMNYPYWAHWLLAPLLWLPFKLNYIALVIIVLVGSLFLLRETGGNPWQLLLSFPLMWVIYYGQTEWIVAAGLLLMWQGLRRRSTLLMGLGLLLASLKPHIAGPAALLMLWQLKDWRLQLKSLWLMGPVFLLSLLVFGWGWPLEWLRTVLDPFYIHYPNSSSLWALVGPWGLLLWIPALLVRLPDRSRVMLFLTTSMLTMPYVPAYSHLILYFFSMPWALWFLNYIPWLQAVVGTDIYKFNFIVPAVISLLIYFPQVYARLRFLHIAGSRERLYPEPEPAAKSV